MDNSILHFLTEDPNDLLVIYESVYVPSSEDPHIPFSEEYQPKALQLTTSKYLDPIYASQKLGYTQEEVSFLMCVINHFVEVRNLTITKLTLSARECHEPHYHRELEPSLYQMHLSCLVPLLKIGDLLDNLLITDRVIVIDHDLPGIYATFFINDLTSQAYQLSYGDSDFFWKEFDLQKNGEMMIIQSQDTPAYELLVKDFT